MSGGEKAARVVLSGASKTFSGTGQVLQPIDLKIEPGEFVAFLGPSGCGKSTLLRMIAGLEVADRGRVEAESFGQKNFRSFVFQEAQLLPWRTALENVVLPLQLIGQTRLQAGEVARSALASVGLSEALERYPSELSGGMKMRVSLARALVTKPTLLLLDEPFAALDENSRHRLQEDLRSLWERTRLTIIFVTHSVSEAAFLSNRAVVFSQRPSQKVLDRKTELPQMRTSRLRTSPEFIREIEAIGASFQVEEAR